MVDMENTTEKKLPAQNLERIATKAGFTTYDDASKHRQSVLSACASGSMPDKVKVIARSDGTFDVAVYGKIKKEAAKEAAPAEVEEAKKVHGLKSKDRRRNDRREKK
jgi:hypothetical protein